MKLALLGKIEAFVTFHSLSDMAYIIRKDFPFEQRKEILKTLCKNKNCHAKTIFRRTVKNIAQAGINYTYENQRFKRTAKMESLPLTTVCVGNKRIVDCFTPMGVRNDHTVIASLLSCERAKQSSSMFATANA